MFQPRNTFVLLRLKLKPDEQVGKLIVPTGDKKYTEAEVVAVGPGVIDAEGGRSENHDLEVGQRVLVKHKRVLQRPGAAGGTQEVLLDDGLKLSDREQDDKEGDLYLFDQANIIAIVGNSPS